MQKSLLTIVIICGLAGCGGHGEHDVAGNAQAVTAQCTPATLAWDQPGANVGVCAGPWEYRTYTYHLGPASAQPGCGENPQTSHPVPNTCRGVASFTTLAFHPTVPAHQVKTCSRLGPRGRCFNGVCPPAPCLQWSYFWAADATCASLASAQLTSEQSAMSSSTDASSYHGTISGIAITNLQTNEPTTAYPTCSFSLTPVPQLGTITDAGQCGVTQVPDPITYKTCQLPDHLGGVDPVKYSASNETLASVESSEKTSRDVDVVTDGSVDHGVPACTTCDDLPLSGASNGPFKDALKDKAQCLLDRLAWVTGPTQPLPADQAATTRAQLVQDLLLLAELDGDKLDPGQLPQIIAAVRAMPTLVQSGCGLSTPPTTATCSPPESLLNSLQMCADLAGASISVDADGALLDGCLDAAADIGQLAPGASCQDLYRASFVSAFDAIVTHRLAGIQLTADTTPNPLLQDALRFIDRWYRAEAAALPAAAVWADVGQVELALRGATHASGVRNLTLPQVNDGGVEADDDQIIRALSNADGSDLAADYATLAAAWTPESDGQLPLATPPLLVVMTDSLHGIADRVRDASAFHDFACHYTPSATSATGADGCEIDNQPSRLGAMAMLLGGFSSGEILTKVVSTADTLMGKDQPNWSSLFKVLSTNHSAFENVVLSTIDPTLLAQLSPDGGYSPSLLLDTRVTATNPALGVLGRIASEFAARAASYAGAGVFDPTLRNTLSGGIQSGSEHQQFVSNLQTQNANLASAVTGYRTNLREIVTDLLGYLQNAGHQYDTKALLDEKTTEFQVQASQLGALQSAEADDDAAFGREMAAFAKDFGNVKDNGAIDPNALVKVDGQHFTNDFNESEAKFTGPSGDQSFSVPSIAVGAFPGQGGSAWKMNVPRGSVLLIDSSGHWSPTCALSQAFGTGGALAGTDGVTPESFAHAVATSEGYLLQKSGDSYQATSQSHSETTTDTLSLGLTNTICGGINLGVFSAMGCTSFDYYHNMSWADANTNSSGTDTRTSASFTSGLHVPNAPLPFMNAGSLALVTMKSGGTSVNDIVDVRPVLSGQNAYVIGAGASDPNVDLYLVANDRADCGTAAGPDKLHIETTLFQPLEATLPKLMNAMSQALDDLGAKRKDLVAAGRFLPNEQAADRSAALAFLAEQGIDLSAYPQPFRDLYAAWVDRQMARLERAVEIANASHQMDLLTMDIQALQTDQKVTTLDSRLAKLLPAWSLQDLEGNQLRFQTGLVTQLLNQLYPVLVLRYPDLLAQLRGSAQLQPILEQLTGAAWDSSFWQLANVMNQAATIIINSAASDFPARTPLNPVALQIPKSARISALYPKCGVNLDESPLVGATIPPAPQGSGSVLQFKQVDQARADAFWKGICESGLGTFEVRPQDIYDVNGGVADLECRDAAPVMRSAALVLTVPGAISDRMANVAVEAPLGLSSQLLFPTDHGIASYQIEDRSFLPSKVPVLAASIGFEVNRFNANQTDVTTGDGLSPFNTYQVNLRALAGQSDSPLQAASAITLVFRAESANTADSVVGVSTCGGN